MKVTDLLKYFKDAGLVGGMAAALLWMNGRLTDVETRLYKCMEARASKSVVSSPIDKRGLESYLELYAIKPKKIKVDNESTI